MDDVMVCLNEYFGRDSGMDLVYRDMHSKEGLRRMKSQSVMLIVRREKKQMRR